MKLLHIDSSILGQARIAALASAKNATAALVA